MCLVTLVRRLAQNISASLLARCIYGRFQRGFRSTVIIFSWSSLTLSLIERNLEEVDFAEDEFLHNKINNKDVYVDNGTTEDIPEDANRQCGCLLALN